jgi:carbonic anhydrase
VNNFSYQAQDWWANNWPLCSTGQLQSPIEIESAGEFQSIELHLSFENADRPLMIQPNGSMRIEYGYGMLTARYPGEEESIYQSTSISFKTPGEHSVDG